MINYRKNFRQVGENRSDVAVPPAVPMVPESVIKIIWRGRWIVLLTTALLPAAAFTYFLKATPIYTSTSRIYVEQSGPKIITEIEEGIMTRSKNYLYTQAELLKSTPILASVLALPGIGQMKTFAQVDNQIAYLKKTLKTHVGKKDDIISVSFDSPYRAEAARLINAVVDSYITYHATQKRSTAAEVLKILQNEKTRRSKELEEKLKAMMDYKKENMALAFENDRGNIIIQRLERLSSALTETQLTTIESNSAYESIKTMVGDPARLKQFIEAQQAKGIYASTGSEKAELRSKVDQLQHQLADRLRQFTPAHPSVKATESEIARAKQKIADLDEEFAQAHLAVAEQQYLTAKEKEDQIAKYFEDQRQKALELNEQLAQYTVLQSDWEQTKKLCDILDDRIKELNVTEDVGALNISVLEVARPADKPSKPQKARIMAIALLVGFILGGGLALVRDWVDGRLRSPEEISDILGVPMLGVVPSMSRRQSVAIRGRKVCLDSTSAVAEAYRRIRTAVFFSMPKDAVKTILITSPGSGDGKSTLVSNLAIAMAQAGQRVLIIDADFRKPIQHNIFEIAREPGLSNVITGTQTIDEAVQYDSVAGLDILPNGPTVLNPSEMLNSDSFSQIMAELCSKYDRIVIDSPPVMPVTDACILGAICDVTLLVLHAERSTRKSCQQARSGLLSVGTHILGVVFNDVPPGRSRYGHYYYEWDYYRYGHTHKKEDDHKKAVVGAAANPDTV